ncbi:ATP-dependent helicase [Stratiformator vulcanicus]|uniref:DNA 3'-5' helicase n=1 Tax=Stratiformator vulcanicus TaxID=2527980 RepID=A0A517R3Q1_9PLAN|nr:ATP-dependent helicase [Stratiformator vulcanicus]QDT38504.1 ATP-dependent DNA helicase UvrD1 [Stratiformator vulcanicus]
MTDGATTPPNLLSDLNEDQRIAVTHEGGPLLIVAGAGTGKTTTLTHRVAALIARGADPRRILLLTFTRRAAAEMLQRVEASLRKIDTPSGPSDPRMAARGVVGGTFHAVSARLLRQFGSGVGLPPDFTVVDRADAEDIVNAVRGELELPQKMPKFPKKATCTAVYSRIVNTGVGLTETLENDYPHLIDFSDGLRDLFRSYRERKRAEAVLDYDDLLLYWDQLLADERAGPMLRKQFDHVLVDEYQDTNPLQASILRQLRPDGDGLTVVGDDAQAIYGFRGATVRNILDFTDTFGDATIVPLELNYRSRQPILDLANDVIGGATERLEKNLRASRPDGPRPMLVRAQDEAEQASFIADEVLALTEQGFELRGQAVLFRSSYHSAPLEIELNRRGIPFHKYGGIKFIETAHVKDLVAFLRLAENPRDSLSARRVLTLLPGIGEKSAARLADRLREADHDFAAWDDFNPPAATKEFWPGFVKLLRQLLGADDAWMSVEEQVRAVRLFYDGLIEFVHDHAATRRKDLEQLEVLSARSSDRRSFLTEMTLDPPTSTRELASRPPEEDEDFLTLSTIHSAKGLEFDAVFVMNCYDGAIPSDMSLESDEKIDEERRLCYVALTRARTHLYCCHPLRQYTKRRGLSDAYGFTPLSRFLSGDVQSRFNERSAGGEPLPEKPLSTEPLANVRSAVDQRLDSMWD